MTVETFTARRAYQIAAAYRRRGIPVVMGGYHPSMLPDESLQLADAVVVGDAEGAWETVLADAAAGRLQPLYRMKPARGGAPSTTAGSSAASAMLRSRWSSRTRLPLRLRLLLDPCLLRHLSRQRPVRPTCGRDRTPRGRKYVFFVDDNLFWRRDAFERLIRGH